MAKVKIIFPGYFSTEDEGRACSNVILVQDQGLNIIVDPGTLPDQQVLLDKLQAEGLTPADIDIVYITHSHLDHYRNIGMFSRAKTLDFYGWWEGDGSKDYSGPVTADIEMIYTPGHSDDGTTFLVKTADGLVAICGDVFWRENFPEDDPYATDKEKLAESRRMVLAAANWVIPGHGARFKADK
ncbi:MAG: hypothetical protein A3J65_02345 [Candidatus Buchananbacteria bacterium RIFCSPHIGHO2_02_FULL_45_11b]|uniref:Metallo-beta-lactamase domain-containing protein n=4 Tax=Candidatus Buchananiibacteriota TaxID=1817903 RepID=A0A1G1YHC5_9BACT|nr:MAG: hypothetical protein A2663_02825 [Candidatus Buchananbacteria bacterium RIFCSPHIGHO2_01_FULL_46_12]OGY51654.1 MAG: hypothetical protein A3J65_02345 [Candidatus Buchananbacteria bacterium RIFCSPHIGHO2_02_FULL_45_11b]OGY52806.1 MAG: hypothetical protein A3B15_01515 [Candidatus Buchananbacteria bacterium RIFCSPLOWO2_01_FULL_45_31]OGY57808.1 MAG: hypothetical protein A3H67_03280 [Candidatus Buchananbacteria bacterium RIFCSPLOWO2_02_FULL_46_11b]